MQNFFLRSSRIWCLCAFISAASPSITIAGSRTPLRFKIVPLGALPGGVRSDPEAINNRGDIVGRSDTRPFLYRNGTMTELPIGDREQDGYAVDINDSGDIIGRGRVNFREHSFLVRRGSSIDLNLQTGLEINVLGINNRGVIIANVLRDRVHDAVTWKDGVVHYVESDPTRDSTAFAINNHGEVLGAVYGQPSPSEPADYYFAIVGRRSTEWLGRIFAGLKLNDRGHVAGEDSSSYAFRTLLYRNGVWRDLGILPGDDRGIRPFAINNSDWVVGLSEGPGEAYRPFLYANGKLHNLNDLIRPDSGWTLIWAKDVNNRGEIVAYGSYQGKQGGLLLQPVKRGHR